MLMVFVLILQRWESTTWFGRKKTFSILCFTAYFTIFIGSPFFSAETHPDQSDLLSCFPGHKRVRVRMRKSSFALSPTQTRYWTLLRLELPAHVNDRIDHWSDLKTWPSTPSVSVRSFPFNILRLNLGRQLSAYVPGMLARVRYWSSLHLIVDMASLPTSSSSVVQFGSSC